MQSADGTPQWCQQNCCDNLACTGFTFTENTDKSFTCWMMEGETRALVPVGPDCASPAVGNVSGCWAAMGNAARAVRWSIEVNGVEMSLRRPIPVPVGHTVSVSPPAPAQIKQGGQCLSTAGTSRSSRVVMVNCSEFDRSVFPLSAIFNRKMQKLSLLSCILNSLRNEGKTDQVVCRG